MSKHIVQYYEHIFHLILCLLFFAQTIFTGFEVKKKVSKKYFCFPSYCS